MGSTLTLTAADGHSLDAYLAPARGKERGAVVIIQEVFGINSHIRKVTDQYAEAGFRSIAPALFDRLGKDITVPYTDVPAGIDLAMKLKNDETLLDMKSAIDYVRPAGKVGVVGYCWGGTMSYLAAARLDIAAAVSYYGGFISNYLDEQLRVPVMFHFGEKDAHIPLSTVEKIRAHHAQQTYHIYPAGHGFNCTDRASFDAASAKLAFERSVEFLKQHVG
ncbi:MAG: dienelactone hydrolase family protein [Proteobacteria bacterium]|nr:dienelactone hydrolase family protein [Pseudomonadota bacterium]